MSEQAAFTAEVFQNQYLPVGGTVADAVLTVAAAGPGLRAAATPRSAAQAIILD